MYTYVLNIHNVIYEWIFRNWDVEVWIGLRWLKIGTGGGHLW